MLLTPNQTVAVADLLVQAGATGTVQIHCSSGGVHINIDTRKALHDIDLRGSGAEAGRWVDSEGSDALGAPVKTQYRTHTLELSGWTLKSFEKRLRPELS